jgi:autotransporter translocation and assembly factor TamB
MRRRLLRLSVAVLLALIPSMIGGFTALLYTGTGQRALGRLVAGELSARFAGRFTIERIGGSFIRSVVLDQVRIQDSTGLPFASFQRLEVSYNRTHLLAGQFLFDHVRLESPDVRLVAMPGGRLNFHRIFRLGEGGGGGGRSPLIEFRDLEVTDGRLDLWLNWAPPDTSPQTPEGVAAALAADRARPGRVVLETRDGYRRVVVLDSLSVKLDRLLVSSPRGDPLTFDVTALSTVVSDPAVRVVDLAADGWTRRDTLALTIAHGDLPNTSVNGGGFITWPHGPLWYDLDLTAPTLDLADLRWISPDFPSFRGKSRIALRTRSGSENSFVLRGLVLDGRQGHVDGDVTVLTDTRRGVGVENMNVRIRDLDLDVPRPYLDTLPLEGTLTGTLLGSGYQDGLDVDADVEFVDRAVDSARSHVHSVGHLRLGGTDGAVFDTLRLIGTDLDLATVRHQAPAVELLGRVTLDGVLRGPWRAVQFDGLIRHHDGDRPESVAEGLSFLDTRGDTTRFRTDVVVAPLVFDGIRAGYPGVPLQGRVTGRIALDGSASRFAFETALLGDLGQVEGEGTLVLEPDRMAAERLQASFKQVDLSMVRRDAPHTVLSGQIRVDGSYDSLAGPGGDLHLTLGHGWIAEVPLDSLELGAAGQNGTVAVDTLLARWPGGKADGSGQLGWRSTDGQSIHVEVEADSLLAWDSLLTRFAGASTDTADRARPLSGDLKGVVELQGTAREPEITAWFRANTIRWRSYHTRAPEVALGWWGRNRPTVGLSLQSDSLLVGNWVARDLLVGAGGYQDSLRWVASAVLGGDSRVATGGIRLADSVTPTVLLDSLTLVLPRRTWALTQPGRFQLSDERLDLSPLVLAAGDGAGLIRLAGSLPRAGEGSLEASVLGLDLRDVYALLQRDTSSIAGTLQLDVTVGGTAAEPTLWGTGSVADLLVGDLGSPFAQGFFNYRDRRLDANLLLWKTGKQVLHLSAALPVDLALATVSRRQLPGPLQIRAVADSTELSVLEAFSRNLRRVRGRLDADVEIAGTWEEPRLGGRLAIRDGAATVPGLGVRYSGLRTAIRFEGDSLMIDSLVVDGGQGSLRATGTVRLEDLARPVLDLRFQPRRFRVIDVRRFLTLDATGQLALRGPLMNARLRGRVTADQAELHFADLLTKRIVDLENPGDSGLIDLDLVRTERLGADFQSRFLDSLRIDTLQVRMGQNVWLRSGEANIQLDGAITVDKLRDSYRVDGELSALRGKYTLWIAGVVTRDFTVERGKVRFFGTPDLNAELDIEAKHTVVAVETGEEIEVIARITGTLLQPKLELTSPPSAQRAPLNQTELVSYLMFGRPTFSQQGQGTAAQQGNQYYAVQLGLTYLSSALTSELQRALVSDLGVPIDYLDIRPGGTGSGTASAAGQGAAAQVAIVSAGWHLGRRWFVTVVADLCTNQQRFYPNVEYRVTRELRIKTAVEPSYSCQVAVNQANLTGSKYQVGLDLLWKRDY